MLTIVYTKRYIELVKCIFAKYFMYELKTSKKIKSN